MDKTRLIYYNKLNLCIKIMKKSRLKNWITRLTNILHTCDQNLPMYLCNYLHTFKIVTAKLSKCDINRKIMGKYMNMKYKYIQCNSS